MFTAKTHFEQVPLSVVKKIVEERLKQKNAELPSPIKPPAKGRRNKFWQQPSSEKVTQ
jgi:hypothetical protein